VEDGGGRARGGAGILVLFVPLSVHMHSYSDNRQCMRNKGDN